MKRIIRNKTLRNNLRRMYYGPNKFIGIQDIVSNNIEINCSKYHIQGVKSVVEYLSNRI